MRIFRFIFLLFALAFPAFANAQTADEFFMLGNTAYKNGEYARAKENYMDAMKAGGASAELSFNLANTCAKLGHKGEALLYYLRAVYENPRMREAEANLEMFAKDNSLTVPFDVFPSKFMMELSDSEWALAAFVSFWIGVLALVFPPLFARKNAAWIFAAIIAFAITATSATALYGWHCFKDTAVAVRPDAPIRVSPTPDAPIVSMAADGSIAIVKKRHGSFEYVETDKKQYGWASKDDFVTVGY